MKNTNNNKKTNFSLQIVELILAIITLAYSMFYPRDTIKDFIVLSILCLILKFSWKKIGLFKPSLKKFAKADLILFSITLAIFLLIWLIAFSKGIVNMKSILEVFCVILIYFYYAFIQHYHTQRYLAIRLLQFNNKHEINSKLKCSPEMSAALLTGFIFAVMHLPYPVLILPSALGGFLYTYYFLNSGRLWSAVVSHALVSSVAIFWLLEENPFNEIFELF